MPYCLGSVRIVFVSFLIWDRGKKGFTFYTLPVVLVLVVLSRRSC
jgi:hypothetical protein